MQLNQPSKEQICKMFGCTMEQLNEQYAANAKQLQEMANGAKGKKKYRGETPEYWQQQADKYKKLAES